MEVKEKAVSAYLWVVLLTMAFMLLLFAHAHAARQIAERGYFIRTQYKAAGEMAPQRKKLDVNTAGAQELEALTGIGPQLAAEIVKEREENGAFETLEDLLRVKGIGPGKLEGFRYEVTIGGER